MEEIVCDSLGQMNAFAVDSGSTVAGRVGMFLRSVNQAAQNSGQTQKNTAENSGGVRYSFLNSSTGMANDALQPYNNEMNRLITEQGGIIIDSYEKLECAVQETFSNRKKKAVLYFGSLSTDVLNRIAGKVENMPVDIRESIFKPGKEYSIAATMDIFDI